MTNLTLLIDESGEAGITKVRKRNETGASPYMTLGGVLIETDKLEKCRDFLEKIRLAVGKKTLHCNRLNHFQKIFFAKQIARLQTVHCFGVISKKDTLGWYRDTINTDSSAYYNKCAQLLLERVGGFMSENDILPHKLDIVFESGNFEYEKLRRLIKKCQDTPRGVTNKQIEQVKLLRNIDAENIIDVSKSEEPVLQIADLVAHALFKCVDKSDRDMKITEPRYLLELKQKFYYDSSTLKIFGTGIKAVHRIDQLGLDADIEEVFSDFMHKLN